MNKSITNTRNFSLGMVLTKLTNSHPSDCKLDLMKVAIQQGNPSGVTWFDHTMAIKMNSNLTGYLFQGVLLNLHVNVNTIIQQ